MLVAAESLTHCYSGHTALDAFSLHLNRQEIVGLVGPNGSGKSTFLRILSTLVRPQQGQVEVCGYDVARHPGAVRERIGVVFQTATLDRLLTVDENLRASAAFHGLFGRKLEERLRWAISLLHLDDRRFERVGRLSGGLLRRAEIARALLNEPRLLLLDEPSAGLDPAAREDFLAALHRLRELSGTAVLLTTHLFEEAEACDSLCFLDQGRRVAEGSPAELRASIGGDVVVLRAPDLAGAAAAIAGRYRLAALEKDGALYYEVEDALVWIPRLAEALPVPADSIGFHRPTLADVFRRYASAPSTRQDQNLDKNENLDKNKVGA